MSREWYKTNRCPYQGISCEECINPSNECTEEEADERGEA